ncbi:hypothetical protein RhiirA5_421180 [Rhizophagus irregularis]|uniref:Uncharacterized protein n=1 Tax=Rhizophagus irregularis TaxID=588596 RepID=A0A2N0RAP4_9GLOM|nr:hypothetical protein RhiirA5_421180 [Rhizophagus irregularis]PKC60377.1 hypothetical protein RhiirA1_468124 [Rhizophagus irregularis]
MGDTIISVTEARREDLNQGIAQSTVQAHASMQCNRKKKRTYDDADLYEGVMYCIVSTASLRLRTLSSRLRKARNAELLKQVIEKDAKRDVENTELKSRIGELEASLAILEQGVTEVNGQPQNDKEVIAELIYRSQT